MDLQAITDVAGLNAIIQARLYRQIPVLADRLLARFAELGGDGDRPLGDTLFWTETGLADLFESQPDSLGQSQDSNDDWIMDLDVDGAVEQYQRGGRALFQVERLGQCDVPKFSTHGQHFRLQIDQGQLTNAHDDLLDGFGQVIEQAFSSAPFNALCGVQISHRNLQYPILVPFSSRDRMTAERVLNIMEQVLQSNEDVDPSEVEIEATTVTPPSASGVPQPVNLDSYLEKSSGSNGCLYKVRNNDKLCIIRTIVCGIARARRNDSPQAKKAWESIRDGKRGKFTTQTNAAMDLVQKAGISSSGPHDISDVRRIQVCQSFWRLCQSFLRLSVNF